MGIGKDLAILVGILPIEFPEEKKREGLSLRSVRSDVVESFNEKKVLGEDYHYGKISGVLKYSGGEKYSIFSNGENKEYFVHDLKKLRA
ncbi:MAG: hypothetical protein PF542_03430 [Nanoarchaeota archaeon]|nr:hypothetical protein [Nanoarchaeota archaeon]